MMLERAILRDHFAEILRAARSAGAEYGRLAQAVNDPAARGELLRLARDEDRHVELSERLLDIVDE